MGGGIFAKMVRSEVRVERGMKRFRELSSEKVTPAYAVLEASAMYDVLMIEEDSIVC